MKGHQYTHSICCAAAGGTLPGTPPFLVFWVLPLTNGVLTIDLLLFSPVLLLFAHYPTCLSLINVLGSTRCVSSDQCVTLIVSNPAIFMLLSALRCCYQH